MILLPPGCRPLPFSPPVFRLFWALPFPPPCPFLRLYLVTIWVLIAGGGEVTIRFDFGHTLIADFNEAGLAMGVGSYFLGCCVTVSFFF